MNRKAHLPIVLGFAQQILVCMCGAPGLHLSLAQLSPPRCTAGIAEQHRLQQRNSLTRLFSSIPFYCFCFWDPIICITIEPKKYILYPQGSLNSLAHLKYLRYSRGSRWRAPAGAIMHFNRRCCRVASKLLWVEKSKVVSQLQRSHWSPGTWTCWYREGQAMISNPFYLQAPGFIPGAC